MSVLSADQVIALIHILADMRGLRLYVVKRVTAHYTDAKRREICFKWFRELSIEDKRGVLTLVTQRKH